MTIFNKQSRITTFYVCILLFLICAGNTVLASVESDILVILSDDARSHVFKETFISDQKDYLYPLPESFDQKQLVFVDAGKQLWQHRSDNALYFPEGNFSIMYRHRYSNQIKATGEEEFEFHSAGPEQTGFTAEGGYEFFSFTWILPQSMEVTSYSSNIPIAKWQQSGNILRFKTENQNHIRLQIRFRRKGSTAVAQEKPLQEESSGEDSQQEAGDGKAEMEAGAQTAEHKPEYCQAHDNTVPLYPLFCSAEEEVILDQLVFERNSASLSPKARKILDGIVPALMQLPQSTFEISAYTDNKGPQSWNQRLSEERAQTVRLYLIYKGVRPSQLLAAGYGEAEPIAPNDTVEGRRQNRRLVFKQIE